MIRVTDRARNDLTCLKGRKKINQTKPNTEFTLCLQHLVAMFPKDPFSEYLGPMSENMLCFYICFSEIVRICKSTLVTRLSRREELRGYSYTHTLHYAIVIKMSFLKQVVYKSTCLNPLYKAV